MNSLDLKNSLDKEGITPNMGKIHRSVVLLVVVCYFLCFIQTAASVRTFYLDDQCDPNITDSQTFYYFVGSPTDNSNSSGILKNSLTNDYFPNITCNAVLSPIGQSGITVSIWRIDLRENCRDNLTFVDSLGVSASFCNSVKNFQESWSFSSNGPLIIQFKTGSEPSNITKGGFEIIFTSFRGSPCPGIGFECQNSHCIWNGLRCNGYNNCGDGSDEEKCRMSVGGIVAIALGCVFLVSVTIFGIVYYRKRRTVV